MSFAHLPKTAVTGSNHCYSAHFFPLNRFSQLLLIFAGRNRNRCNWMHVVNMAMMNTQFRRLPKKGQVLCGDAMWVLIRS